MNLKLKAVIDRLNDAIAGGTSVILTEKDASLIYEHLHSFASTHCSLQDEGEICGCGLLDRNCPNRYTA